MDDCIFCKIIKGEIPSHRFYEDEKMIVIADIAPKAKKHYLAIPKTHYKLLSQMTDEQAAELGECMLTVGKIAPSLGLQDGYRLVINQGDAAEQTVPHLHLHLLGGQKLVFPDYADNE